MAAARFLISAAHKSSGKTIISIGLCAAYKARGLAVQPYKKGPDYIDPMWLSTASGRDCRNLDFHLMDTDEILSTFNRHLAGADMALVEANKGLHDGLALDGSNSNAALALLLGLPVVLVIDTRGMTRGIAPLLLGHQNFDRNIRITGVILNHVGGARHEEKLRAAIGYYTDIPVLGAVHHHPKLEIIERHLGLVPSNESDDAMDRIVQITESIGAQVDLEKLMQVTPHSCPPETQTVPVAHPVAGRIRVGIARDKAFGFYYADDLDAFRQSGAELVSVNTLQDRHLPDVNALFIGGGFPECFARELEANTALKKEICNAIEAGLPVYAECGGLMYLARSLTWKGHTARMVGVIPADVVMHDKPIGRGYVQLHETGKSPWPRLDSKAVGVGLRAHEFHHSSLENLDAPVEFAYDVVRGHGADGQHDGIVYKNMLASYSHLHAAKTNNWVARFVALARKVKFREQGKLTV